MMMRMITMIGMLMGMRIMIIFMLVWMMIMLGVALVTASFSMMANGGNGNDRRLVEHPS